MTHHLQDRCVCMIFKNWKKKNKQTQLSEETRQESDELATQHRQPHGASVRDDSVVMDKVLKGVQGLMSEKLV